MTGDLPGPRYYADPADWERVIGQCRGRPAGWDTEFYGVNLRSRDSTDTCCGRAVVHVWSVALRTGRLHPRGYHRAVSAVFPATALVHPAVVAWLLDGDSPKIGINTPVDVHAAENTIRLLGGGEVRVRGTVDIISGLRWLHPERVAPGPGFGLDSIGRDLLGRGKLDDFEEVLGEPNVVSVERRETAHQVVCECGARPCRKRRSTPGHAREKETHVKRWEEQVVRGTRLIPLWSVVPGHERFERLVAYAGVDAELALEAEELVSAGIRQLNRPVPWS